MNDNGFLGAIIIISIIGLALFGGFKNKNGGLLSSDPVPPPPSMEFPQGTAPGTNASSPTGLPVATGDYSPYKGVVSFSFINRGIDASQEYVTLRMNYNTSSNVDVTGWTLKSLSSGVSVTIPKGTYLYFTDSQNVEDDIYMQAQDTLYLVTGISPNGASFKTNKCSGYLSQQQTFTPSLWTSCPAPRDENLSSIPRTLNNDACFDYIDSYPSCQIQTTSLPANWSYECTNFIYTKINYPSCVNTHKNDKDFYGHEWRVYLKRSERLWKDRREDVVLYDRQGKVVDEIKY